MRTSWRCWWNRDGNYILWPDDSQASFSGRCFLSRLSILSVTQQLTRKYRQQSWFEDIWHLHCYHPAKISSIWILIPCSDLSHGPWHIQPRTYLLSPINGIKTVHQLKLTPIRSRFGGQIGIGQQTQTWEVRFEVFTRTYRSHGCSLLKEEGNRREGIDDEENWGSWGQTYIIKCQGSAHVCWIWKHSSIVLWISLSYR